MAHFAELDSDNIVLRVIVINNTDITDENGAEQESLGIAFCKNLFGNDTIWVQTSYNNNFRKQYTGRGMTYDADKDKFIAQQPYPSWSLDENDDWQPPVPYPSIPEGADPVDHPYAWDEDNQKWVQ